MTDMREGGGGQGRRHVFEGGGVNGLEGGGQYSKNTNIWKRWGCMTPPPSSYNGAAPPGEEDSNGRMF